MEKIFFSLLRGSNFVSGRGTVFWGVSLWASPPVPLPLPLCGGHPKGAIAVVETDPYFFVKMRQPFQGPLSSLALSLRYPALHTLSFPEYPRPVNREPCTVYTHGRRLFSKGGEERLQNCTTHTWATGGECGGGCPSPSVQKPIPSSRAKNQERRKL